MERNLLYLQDGTTVAVKPDHWPVNEIILRQLVLAGFRNTEIASLYKVSVSEVIELRRHYDL